jgi:hypothetical protein
VPRWSIRFSRNEKYVGNNVYNRISFKLKKKRVRNSPDMWVRRDGAFEPIVEPSLFYMARGIILERARRFTNDEMLQKLKALLDQHTTLSAELIDNTDSMPSSSSYQSRFGSLVAAYRAVGYDPGRDYRYVEANRHLRALYPGFVDDVVKKLEALGASITRMDDSGQLLVNGEYTAEIIFTRCTQTPAGPLRWLIDLDRSLAPDITVVVRMDTANQVPMDFYFLPRIDMAASVARLGDNNGFAIDTYRFHDVAYFVKLAARAEIEVAA